MTVFRAFAIVILSGLGFALGGGAIGYTLATVTPAYYRGVFGAGNDPNFDPVQVGVGLGITQGLVCGVIIGAVVVLAVAWYQSRRPDGGRAAAGHSIAPVDQVDVSRFREAEKSASPQIKEA